MRGPAPVRLLTVLALISVGAAVLIVAVAFAAVLVSPGDGVVANVVRGALSALGYSHEAFGAYEVGEVFGGTAFDALPPLAILLAIRIRRLWLLRTAAVLWVVFAVSNGGWTLLPLVAVVLAFLPPTRRHFRERLEDEGEALINELESPGAV